MNKSFVVHAYSEPFIVTCKTEQDVIDFKNYVKSQWMEFDQASFIQKDRLISIDFKDWM